LLLERLTGDLCLPNEGEEFGLRPGQKHAQKAAEGRWRKNADEGNGKVAELRAAGEQGGW
jgi:hypothetical protein